MPFTIDEEDEIIGVTTRQRAKLKKAADDGARQEEELSVDLAGLNIAPDPLEGAPPTTFDEVTSEGASQDTSEGEVLVSEGAFIDVPVEVPNEGEQGTIIEANEVEGPMDDGPTVEESIMKVMKSSPKIPTKLVLKPRSIRVITSSGKTTLKDLMIDYPITSDEDDEDIKYWFQTPQGPDPPSNEPEVVKPPDERVKDKTVQVVELGVIDLTARRTRDPTPHIGVSSSRDRRMPEPNIETLEGGPGQVTQGTISTRTRKMGVSYNDNPHRVTSINQLWRIKDTKLQHSGTVMVGNSTLGRDAGDGLFYTGPDIDNGVSTWITSYNNRFWLSENKGRDHGDDIVIFVDDRGRNVYVPRNTLRYGGYINDPLDES